MKENSRFEPTDFARELQRDSIPALGFDIWEVYFPDSWKMFTDPMPPEWRHGLMASTEDSTAFSYRCGSKDLAERIIAFVRSKGCLVSLTWPPVGEEATRPFVIRFAEPGTRCNTMESSGTGRA